MNRHPDLRGERHAVAQRGRERPLVHSAHRRLVEVDAPRLEHRAVALWGPAGESARTFGGVDLQTSDGFGQNRASKAASAMGQYEGHISETGTYRILATAYANDYGSAGLLRATTLSPGRAVPTTQ